MYPPSLFLQSDTPLQKYFDLLPLFVKMHRQVYYRVT